MNRDRRTIKKYAEMESFNPGEQLVQTRTAPVMDPVKPIIDQWLVEDMGKKKKFRRTAKRIYDLLVKKHGFKGSDRSVQDYVAKRKMALLEESDDAFLPLEARPGTAQVDFGEAPFKHRGKEVIQPYLVLSLPNSNSFLFQVFPSENRECFLQGLTNMFTFAVEEKRNALQLLSVLLKEQSFELSVQALNMASEHGHPTVDAIKHVYYQLVNGRGIRETLSLPPSIPTEQPTTRGLSHYDRLMLPFGGDLQ